MSHDVKYREVPIRMGAPARFPYLVVRLMATVYQNEKIYVGPTPPKNPSPRSIVVVHPDPWDGDRLRPEVRQEVIDKALALCVRVKSFRMCVVFSKDDQVYLEPDGSIQEMSDAIPSARLLVPVDHAGRPTTSARVGKSFRIPAVSLQPKTLPSGERYLPAKQRRKRSTRAGKAVTGQEPGSGQEH